MEWNNGDTVTTTIGLRVEMRVMYDVGMHDNVDAHTYVLPGFLFASLVVNVYLNACNKCNNNHK